MKKFAFAGAALVALTALPALAQPTGGQMQPAQPMARADVQAKVQSRFARVDADRDGFVTQAEAQAARATRAGARGERVAGRRGQMFDRLDTNRDGVLSRAEFDARAALRGGEGRGGERFGRRGMRGGHGGMRGGFGPGAFAALDANRDGRVSLAEATARALAMFDRADTNRDGVVTPQERQAARAAFRASRGG